MSLPPPSPTPEAGEICKMPLIRDVVIHKSRIHWKKDPVVSFIDCQGLLDIAEGVGTIVR